MKKKWDSLRTSGSFSFLAVLVLMVGMLQFSCGSNKTVDGEPGGNTIVGTVQSVACPETGTLDIAMQNSRFNPASVTAQVNTVVKWTNYDAFTAHTATSDIVPENGSFSSPMLQNGQSICYKFTSPGTYSYHCSDHMQATITIE